MFTTNEALGVQRKVCIEHITLTQSPDPELSHSGHLAFRPAVIPEAADSVGPHLGQCWSPGRGNVSPLC